MTIDEWFESPSAEPAGSVSTVGYAYVKRVVPSFQLSAYPIRTVLGRPHLSRAH
jgi:hypothetical protein